MPDASPSLRRSSPDSDPARSRLGMRSIVLLLLCFLPLFALGLVDLRFVRDDWMNAVDLLDLRRLPYGQALGQLITNAWFGAHERRVFFLSWIVEFHLLLIGGRSAWLSYAVILSLHAGAGLLVARTFFTLTGDRFLAMAAALAALFAPTFTQGVFFINNLFFVQPWFFLALVGCLLAHPRRRRGTDFLCLSAAALACQFSGEAAIFSLYAVLGVACLGGWRGRRGPWQGGPLRPLAAGLVAAAALLVYAKGVMAVGRPQPAPHFDWAACRYYLASLWRVGGQFYFLKNERYGYGGIPPGATVAAATLSSLLVGFFLLRPADPPPAGARRRLFGLWAALGAALAGAVGILLLGAILGTRPGVETRYLYVSGELAVLLGLATLFLAAGAWPAARRRLLPALLLAGLGWCLFLDYYNLVDVWGGQKRIDLAIWRTLDPMVTGRTRQIVTYNPNHAYLMAPYHSNAVSDFQADWGISGRLRWLGKSSRLLSIARMARRLPNGLLEFTGYYGATWTGREDETVFVTYLYGPRFKDLPSAQLRVFTRYDDFARYLAATAAAADPRWKGP